MAETANDEYPPDGYHENTPSNDPATTLSRISGQRRRATATITTVRVASIETVTMTPAEEAEAIEALAVLIARYWRDHPPPAP